MTTTKKFTAALLTGLVLAAGAQAREVGYGVLIEKNTTPSTRMKCSNDTFGDPANRIKKSCYDSMGLRIAGEGEEFTVPGHSTNVKYGHIIVKEMPSGTECSNKSFGIDPAHGKKKACYVNGFKNADEGGTISY
jgi:hypothetical protein